MPVALSKPVVILREAEDLLCFAFAIIFALQSAGL
jgi:hypothetical protein